MFLVDTNYLSETRKVARANQNVMAWSRANPDRTLHLSVITVLEIELGICRLARRDLPQSEMLRQWLQVVVLPNFEGRIIDVDLAISQRTAALHVPDPRPHLDALIAATALVHGLTVVTRNTADFNPMGVSTLDPWSWTA